MILVDSSVWIDYFNGNKTFIMLWLKYLIQQPKLAPYRRGSSSSKTTPFFVRT